MIMKSRYKHLIGSLLAVFLVIAIFTFFNAKESLSGLTAAGVRGTMHDLSEINPDGINPWLFATDEVCVFCHSPHIGTQGIAPIWNKSLSTSSFTMYSSSTLNMNPAASLGSPSTLCMSCHDGTMAMNAVVNSPGRGSTGTIPVITVGDPTQLGQLYYPGSPLGLWPNISGSYAGNTSVDNLADEHPVSFTYTPTADRQNNNFPAAVSGAINGTVTNTQYRLYGASSNQFECSTCHDVHDTASYTKQSLPGDPGEIFFLRTSNVRSRMCRDCHVNKF